MAGDALKEGMLLKVMPSEPPIEVVSVDHFDRDGEPCWLIVGKPRRVRHIGGGCVERTSYIVPQSYTEFCLVA